MLTFYGTCRIYYISRHSSYFFIIFFNNTFSVFQAVVVCACIALTTAQFGYDVDFSDGYFGTNFGASGFGASGFGGLSAAAARDPRANTGEKLINDFHSRKI